MREGSWKRIASQGGARPWRRLLYLTIDGTRTQGAQGSPGQMDGGSAHPGQTGKLNSHPNGTPREVVVVTGKHAAAANLVQPPAIGGGPVVAVVRVSVDVDKVKVLVCTRAGQA